MIRRGWVFELHFSGGVDSQVAFYWDKMTMNKTVLVLSSFDEVGFH